MSSDLFLATGIGVGSGSFPSIFVQEGKVSSERLPGRIWVLLAPCLYAAALASLCNPAYTPYASLTLYFSASLAW